MHGVLIIKSTIVGVLLVNNINCKEGTGVHLDKNLGRSGSHPDCNQKEAKVGSRLDKFLAKCYHLCMKHYIVYN